MQDFGLSDLGWAFGSIFCVSIIGILWTRRAAIVSIVSGQWRASLERARQQKAARERTYGYVDMSSRENRALSTRAVSPVSDTNTDTGINPIDTAVLALHLTEDQFIEIGALMRNKNGKPVFSGKKLYGLAGGNYNEFVEKMRRIRGGDGAVDEHVSHTPIVGRPTNARFGS